MKRFLPKIRKEVWGWAFYDWANSAFATTVMAGFFPVFFKSYWSQGLSSTESTFYLGLTNSLAAICIVIMAPVLGAIADQGGSKKKFLAAFASMGVLVTAGLFFLSAGDWSMAALLFGLGLVAFSGGNLFCDSLLLTVAKPAEMDRVSALGFALGYLGGGLLFLINVGMTVRPDLFGLRDSSHAVQVSFLTVSVWWALFSLPLLMWVREARGRSAVGRGVVLNAFRQLRDTFKRIRAYRMTFLFLVGYWFYIDGVDTIIKMAVDYGLSLGFDSQSLILAILITQFVGFPAAIVFGRLGERFGTKRAILLGIGVYAAVTVYSYFMDSVQEFYALAVTIGLVQGGVQSLSRSFYGRLIPQDRAAEFFGFYNMMGKFAAVLGPILMGWVGLMTGSARISILSILILFFIGGALLWMVDEKSATGGKPA